MIGGQFPFLGRVLQIRVHVLMLMDDDDVLQYGRRLFADLMDGRRQQHVALLMMEIGDGGQHAGVDAVLFRAPARAPAPAHRHYVMRSENPEVLAYDGIQEGAGRDGRVVIMMMMMMMLSQRRVDRLRRPAAYRRLAVLLGTVRMFRTAVRRTVRQRVPIVMII